MYKIFYPNIVIALGIFLAVLVTAAIRAGSISKPKLIKITYDQRLVPSNFNKRADFIHIC